VFRGLDRQADAAGQPLASHGHADAADLRDLLQGLEPERRLAGDHVEVVERVDYLRAVACCDGAGDRHGVRPIRTGPERAPSRSPSATPRRARGSPRLSRTRT